MFALLGVRKDIIFIIKKSIFDKRYLVPVFCVLSLLLRKLFAARIIKRLSKIKEYTLLMACALC